MPKQSLQFPASNPAQFQSAPFGFNSNVSRVNSAKQEPWRRRATSKPRGKKKRRQSAPIYNDAPSRSRHSTRASKIGPNTVISKILMEGDPDYDEFCRDQLIDDDDDDDDNNNNGNGGDPGKQKVAEIWIPDIVELNQDADAATFAQQEADGLEDEEEITDDEYYAKLHLLFELKEQALREQWTGTRKKTRFVRKGGEVSSTELLFAPAVGSKFTEEDQIDVIGKVVNPEIPEQRLKQIEEKLEKVEQSYEQRPKHFSRYYLHTRWKPEIVIEKPPPQPQQQQQQQQAQSQKKPRLVLKLKRLKDKGWK